MEEQMEGKPLDLLKKVFGYSSFRPGQEEIIQAILAGRDSLCVMPTGGGKSICYQLPALMLPGVTLVISPLISLMHDQVNALRQIGIDAECITSGMDGNEYNEVFFMFSSGMFRIVYVSPERLSLSSFPELCTHLNISLVAVDEAHCISQWGQDFRPAYLRIAAFVSTLPERPVVAAFTATATPAVCADIVRYLALRDPLQISTGFDRPNLSFSVLVPENREEKLISLLKERVTQSGIIYCSTRKTVEQLCDVLCLNGLKATRYHAGLSAEERSSNQQDFLFDRKNVMVATNAFGMGIDKSNVSFVIHYNIPQSLEAYYQEAGRAGRDGCDADCILFYHAEDLRIAEYLIDNADVNPDLTYEMQEEVRDKQRLRLRRMKQYALSGHCLRAGLLSYFGEKAPARCNNCSVCEKDCLMLDITVDAQKILSCVAREKETQPSSVIISLLLGQAVEDPSLPVPYHSLSTFGIMSDSYRSRIAGEIILLCDRGYLFQDPDTHVLHLTDRSSELLYERKRLTVKSKELSHDEDHLISEALFRELKYLRLKLSSKEHVASFVLFSDALLKSICKRMPTDPESLSEVEGMGRFRTNRYGKEILEVVRKHL